MIVLASAYPALIVVLLVAVVGEAGDSVSSGVTYVRIARKGTQPRAVMASTSHSWPLRHHYLRQPPARPAAMRARIDRQLALLICGKKPGAQTVDQDGHRYLAAGDIFGSRGRERCWVFYTVVPPSDPRVWPFTWAFGCAGPGC